MLPSSTHGQALRLLGRAPFITMCNPWPSCPSGSCLGMREGAAHLSLPRNLFSPWKLSKHASELLPEPRLAIASNFSIVPLEEWSGSFNSASWERGQVALSTGSRAGGSELEHVPSLTFPHSGCFLSGRLFPFYEFGFPHLRNEDDKSCLPHTVVRKC